MRLSFLSMAKNYDCNHRGHGGGGPWRFLALLTLFALPSSEVWAQTCPAWTVLGTVSSGDGSVIPGNVALYWTGGYPNPNAGNATANGQTAHFALSGGVIGNAQGEFYAGSGSYFWSPIGGSMTCTRTLTPIDCTTCSGGFSLSLYATSGAIEGTLEVIPTPQSLAGFSIWAKTETGAASTTTTDASGHFEWRATTEPARSNNWGIGVAPHYSPWPHSAEGSMTYLVGVGPGVDPGDSEVVTVKSSKLSTAALSIKCAYCEDPEMQCDAGNTGPSTNVGKPVNVVTGNAHFDQVDARLPGLPGLKFARAYNSKNAFRNVPSLFGRGWTHTYERSIRFPETTVLVFREENGVPIYYQDSNADQTYEAVLPATERSWIAGNSGVGYTRHLREGGSETYDAAGRLATIVDPSGNTVTLGRDATGRLLTIADSGGRSLSLSYDSNSRLISVTGPAGPLATYEYDSVGLLQKVAYPDGSGYTFTYDSVGQVLRVDDLTGRPVEGHTYDSSGYALTSELGDGQEKLTLAYDLVNGSTTVTDALGNVTTYRWQTIKALRRVTKITGPCTSCGGGGGIDQEWTYDDIGRVLTYKDGDENVTTYTYDSQGDLITAVDALENATGYTKDSQGRVLTRTAPGGSITTYTHSPHGPLTVTEAVTSSQNRTTTITYTAVGRPATITDPRGKVTTMSYNSFGDLVTVTDPLSHVTNFGYDSLGRRTAVTDALNHMTTTTYDARGRVLRITNADDTHTDFTYDVGGRRETVTDPMGRVTRYTYDPYGRLQTVTDPMNGVTTYSYDVMSNLISLRDANGNATTFEYDGYGRVKRVTYPGGLAETFTYENGGHLLTKTDRKGTVTTFGYDDLGRLTSKTYSDSTPTVTYTYDAQGRLLTAANGTDTLTWTYDLAGQLLSEASAKNSSTVAYTHDLGGNRLSVGLDGTTFVTYAYDDASRLTAITRGTSNFGFGYDNANRRTSMTYPNGINTSYDYDDLNRLERLKADLGPTPITDFQYTHDNAGNRTKKQQLDYTEDYSYDPLYRLTGVERSAGLTGIWHYGYDPVGNRITNQINDSVLTSIFNERNQLTSSSGGGTLRVRGTLNESGAATVNGNPARMLAGNIFEATIQATTGTNTFAVEATDQSGNVTTKNYQVSVNATGATYTYDLNGNLIQKVEGADTWTYEWMAENQLKRVLRNSVEQARLAYDPMGRRVEKVTGSVTTSWTYDENDILRENVGASSSKYVHGLETDEPLAREDATGTLAYYHADGLGSITKITSPIGAVSSSYRYEAFGSVEPTPSASFSFTGREWDIETGLFYYRARYYDPKSGRFVGEDPIRWAGGLNLYGYVGNEPISWRDPWGLKRRSKGSASTTSAVRRRCSGLCSAGWRRTSQVGNTAA